MPGGTLRVGQLKGRSGPLKSFRKAIVFASDANKTLTDAEVDGKILDVSSSVSLTATRNLVLPLADGNEFVVRNNTTGGQSIQVIGATGTGVTIANGKVQAVWSDGTNYYPGGGAS